jgi:hypothetical protein
MEGNHDSASLHAKLDRILAGQDIQPRQGGLELALMIVLALTALASTWCAYQSSLWNGAQLVRLADADALTQRAHEQTLAAQLHKTMDAVVFFEFLNAVHHQDTIVAQAIHRRMTSPMRETIDAWMALDPLNNPDAPPPGKMPQYVLIEDQEAGKAREEAATTRASALESGSHGDTYVLLTLLFASVLFFGGLAGTLHSRRLRRGLAGIAAAMFLVTVSIMATVPVSWD